MTVALIRSVTALATAFVVAAAMGCSSRGGSAVGSAPAPERDGAAVASPVPVPVAAPVYDDLEPAASDDRADGGTVKVKLLADARREAHVLWGRKDLGVAPLELVRPRGSAPMDLTIQAPDCLPLHVRVFTDRDDTLSLRLYTEREASGLPGYSPTVKTTTKGPIPPGKTRHQ